LPATPAAHFAEKRCNLGALRRAGSLKKKARVMAKIMPLNHAQTCNKGYSWLVAVCFMKFVEQHKG